MKAIKIEECKYCGSKNFTKGYQYAQGCVYPELWGVRLGSPVEHTICKECGSIVHSRVTKLDKFK